MFKKLSLKLFHAHCAVQGDNNVKTPIIMDRFNDIVVVYSTHVSNIMSIFREAKVRKKSNLNKTDSNTIHTAKGDYHINYL